MALLHLSYANKAIMKIHVNKQIVEAADGASIADVLAQLSFPAAGIAVAVDNKVVPAALWSQTALAEGSSLTVIRAVCGG